MEGVIQHDVDKNQQELKLWNSTDGCTIGRMEFKDRLKQAITRSGIKQADLARSLGVSAQTVNYWLIGRNKPSRSRISLISSILKCSPIWLEFGLKIRVEKVKRDVSPKREFKESTTIKLKENRIKAPHVFGANEEDLTEEIEEIEETNLMVKEFPLISWVQAGQWSEIVDNFQPGDAETWVTFGISRRDIPNGFCLRVRGDSMEPEFADGDIILVDPHKQPENGQFVIAKLLDTNEATFKKYVIDAGVISLHPLNYPKHQPIHLNGRKALIVGVVIAKQKMY